jgi:hypothetical protein
VFGFLLGHHNKRMAEQSMNFFQHFGSIPVTHGYRYPHDQSSAITPKTSSWFRRPAKVSKLGGKERSPRCLVRRRTTTALVHAPSRQRSITDGKGHQKHFSTPSSTVNHEGTGRPLSWHSTSVQQPDQYFLPSTVQFQSDVSPSQYLAPTFTANELNEAITPMTYPFAGEPFVQGAFTPLEEMSSQDFDDRYAFLNEFSADKDVFCDPQYESRYAGLTESGHHYPNGLYLYQKQPEYCLRQFEETTPPTPGVGPLQTSTGLIIDEPLDAVERAGAEDLVGMGLYDAPSPVPASMSFLGSSWDIPIRPISGKGLKLEETFEPTTTEDDDDDDEAAASEDGEGDKPSPDQAHNSMLPDLGQEDERPSIEQNTSATFNFTPDFTNQGSAWWDTNTATNHVWM